MRPINNAQRCPRCGGMVEMPCLLCKVKSVDPDKVYENDEGQLAIELMNDDRTRFNRIKRNWKGNTPPSGPGIRMINVSQLLTGRPTPEAME